MLYFIVCPFNFLKYVYIYILNNYIVKLNNFTIPWTELIVFLIKIEIIIIIPHIPDIGYIILTSIENGSLDAIKPITVQKIAV